MKVALVHDDLIQWGGAERVLQALSEIFPDAPIYTSIYNPKNPHLKRAFANKKIRTSFLQKIPFNNILYRALVLFYPMAFEQFDFSEYDLVISQTTRFAKSVITKPKTRHICFCHTPPRFLWNFSGEVPPVVIKPFLSFLRIYDRSSSKRVDKFIAGSENAKKRIEKVYQQKALVCQPFVEVEKFKTNKNFQGDYYLVVSRLVKYKKVDLAVECFNKRGDRLIVVGDGPELSSLIKLAQPNVEFLGKVSDRLLTSLLSGCKGLIVPAEEDFGMTALEAQAAGKGVIAYGVGGSRETVKSGLTGVFFDRQTKESLSDALTRFEGLQIDQANCLANAERFSRDKFKVKFQQTIDSLYSSSA